MNNMLQHINAVYIISCYIDLQLNRDEIVAVTGCSAEVVEEVIVQYENDQYILRAAEQRSWQDVGCEFDQTVS